MTGWILTALTGALLVVIILLYNSLVNWQNRVRNGSAQIDVPLKRRHDRIPNLVEVCKAYMTYERETLESLIRLRSQALRTTDAQKRRDQESQVSLYLRQVFALVENYPQLKASENLLALQEELASTENEIAFARQFYNDCIMEYKTRLAQFPTRLIASLFGLRPAPFFQMELAAERPVPQVRL